MGLLKFNSGRWESNPVLTLPKRKYYRYTTARLRQGYGGEAPLTFLLRGFKNRAAENRTRVSHSRSVYTTAVLQHVMRNSAHARMSIVSERPGCMYSYSP